MLTDYDRYLFRQGNLFQGYKIFGAQVCDCVKEGVVFTVWAPNAREVRVVGDFNDWQGQSHVMNSDKDSGVWSLLVPEARQGDLYKYEIHTTDGRVLLKSDPYAFYSELRPGTASCIYSLSGYSWGDAKWYQTMKDKLPYNEPLLIYEVHLGSWKRRGGGQFLTYRELAKEIVDYVLDMGYTHVELLPITEHPYDGSWGYQSTGYFSVTSRYGTPHDFMYFVDQCHQNGIGVILDWVPGHFCKDSHGLALFDGQALYEYEEWHRAENTEWGTSNFNLGKAEVKSFLISNALFWMDVFHIDGLRVDAVASMLYLDYAKKNGYWVPNKYGGNENLDAISFLKQLNEVVFKYYPGALMIAEESTQWPMVTAPTYLGGLGFNFKWNMGWMNDTLAYMKKDPIYRKWDHNKLTFSVWYAFSENFILPLSHDEVVHCKKSLLDKMPGDYWQKFANLRVLYGYMMTHPGKKLLFMGGEIGQFDEWNEQVELCWSLLNFDMHKKMRFYVKNLNHFYRKENSMWELDHKPEGFEWISYGDSNKSIIVYMRKGKAPGDLIVVVCNFTPVVYESYRIGVPYEGEYNEVFNSDLEIYGGSGQVNRSALKALWNKWHNQPCSLDMKIPPLAISILKLDIRYD